MKKVIAIFMLVLIMMSMMTVVSFATETGDAGAGTTASASTGKDGDVFDKAKTIFDEVRGKIMGIASAAAGVGLVISLCMWGAGNTKHSQAGWEWAKRIVVAYIAIMSITLILSTINSLAGI